MAPHPDPSSPSSPPITTTTTTTQLSWAPSDELRTNLDLAVHPPSSSDKPQPRPPKSSAHLSRIRLQNRRREYLEQNPKYFDSADHELADPLLYDTLIRRFLTPAEREADSKTKGYARVLEGSLLRGEERLAKLRESNPAPVENGGSAEEEEEEEDEDEKMQGVETGDPGDHEQMMQKVEQGTRNREGGGGEDDEEVGTTRASRNAELLTPPKTRAEGEAQWREFLRDRFIQGKDDDFDYEGLVDGNDEFDGLERREREEKWFEDESPGWASGEDDGGMHVERELKGETGIQDF
ncbi:coiled-coil domain-containing protein [Cladorrhinum samala]|uniref:Coiled-coil domain-containing protein n=1 Tax=Cladorrhinum samala TaxID=585594 RepID=A0AAV9HHV0_9PEZI|nr:coiled-coil domain-containing protein [Cladorrhinum samala]